MVEPVFYYDLSSPYAYLAAMRIDEVLPVRPQWRPIAFGVLFQRAGKVPWSFASDRSARFEEISRRAAGRGLPPLRYPEGWPADTYSFAPLRAALLASDQDQLRAVTRELYRTAFVDGQHLADVEAVLDAAQRAGLDREAVRAGLASQEIKDRLREHTEDAASKGVDGVPTVLVGEQLFWGDDRLEDAAAELQRTGLPGTPG